MKIIIFWLIFIFFAILLPKLVHFQRGKIQISEYYNFMRSEKSGRKISSHCESKESTNNDNKSSLLPVKQDLDEDFSQQLRDLSPFPETYGNQFFSNEAMIQPLHLSIIQTPVGKASFQYNFDHPHEAFRDLSGMIAFQKNQQNYSQDGGKNCCDSSQRQKQGVDQNDDSEQNFNGKSAQADRNSQFSRKEQFTPKNKQKNTENSSGSEILIASTNTNKKRIFCNCKKTKCLKLYCDCFRENNLCGEGCNCQGCHNLQDFEQERKNAMLSLMDRNPLAFIPKIDTEKQHSKGCNCKKSNCQKKYCECFQAGIKCGNNCKCEECKNGKENEKGKGGIKEEMNIEEWID